MNTSIDISLILVSMFHITIGKKVWRFRADFFSGLRQTSEVYGSDLPWAPLLREKSLNSGRAVEDIVPHQKLSPAQASKHGTDAWCLPNLVNFLARYQNWLEKINSRKMHDFRRFAKIFCNPISTPATTDTILL